MCDFIVWVLRVEYSVSVMENMLHVVYVIVGHILGLEEIKVPTII
jgi:hypothetical protein